MQIGWSELLILLVILILLFGSPKLAEEIGRGVRNLLIESRTTHQTNETENPIKIFVSSTMADLAEERKIVADAIRQIPIARPWLFEQSSPSSDTAEETYLEQVRQSDIFILIIGSRVSDAVVKEYQTAAITKKPILVFIKKGEKEDSAKEIIRSLRIKWSEFSTKELQSLVLSAVGSELIKGYRRFRLSVEEYKVLLVFLLNLPGSGKKEDEWPIDGKWEFSIIRDTNLNPREAKAIMVNENGKSKLSFSLFQKYKFKDNPMHVIDMYATFGTDQYWKQNGRQITIEGYVGPKGTHSKTVVDLNGYLVARDMITGVYKRENENGFFMANRQGITMML